MNVDPEAVFIVLLNGTKRPPLNVRVCQTQTVNNQRSQHRPPPSGERGLRVHHRSDTPLAHRLGSHADLLQGQAWRKEVLGAGRGGLG